jgi:hypothetical protein
MQSNLNSITNQLQYPGIEVNTKLGIKAVLEYNLELDNYELRVFRGDRYFRHEINAVEQEYLEHHIRGLIQRSASIIEKEFYDAHYTKRSDLYHKIHQLLSDQVDSKYKITYHKDRQQPDYDRKLMGKMQAGDTSRHRYGHQANVSSSIDFPEYEVAIDIEEVHPNYLKVQLSRYGTHNFTHESSAPNVSPGLLNRL